MLYIFLFIYSFIFSTEQTNLFKNTIEIFNNFNQSKNFNYQDAATQLDHALNTFCDRNSIAEFNTHSNEINSLLMPFLEQSRSGSFNSILYSHPKFLKQIEAAGMKEWSSLSSHEQAQFSKTLHCFNTLDSYIRENNYPSKPKTIKKLAISAYIISLAKPLS